jgi:hypothetical protein
MPDNDLAPANNDMSLQMLTTNALCAILVVKSGAADAFARHCTETTAMITELAVRFFSIPAAAEKSGREFYRVLRAHLVRRRSERAPTLPSLTAPAVSLRDRKVLCGNNLRQQEPRAPLPANPRGGAQTVAGGHQKRQFLSGS